MASRFDDAVQLPEEAFVGELNGLDEHLLERLSGQTDGKPREWSDSPSRFFGRLFDDSESRATIKATLPF